MVFRSTTTVPAAICELDRSHAERDVKVVDRTLPPFPDLDHFDDINEMVADPLSTLERSEAGCRQINARTGNKPDCW